MKYILFYNDKKLSCPRVIILKCYQFDAGYNLHIIILNIYLAGVFVARRTVLFVSFQSCLSKSFARVTGWVPLFFAMSTKIIPEKMKMYFILISNYLHICN